MPIHMAFSSPIDFADRSADYWKRQLTLEETEKIVCWASSLNGIGSCLCAFAITLILLGKGKSTEESGIGPVAHFLLSILSSTFISCENHVQLFSTCLATYS